MRYTQDMLDEIRMRRESGQTWDSIAEGMNLASGKAACQVYSDYINGQRKLSATTNPKPRQIFTEKSREEWIQVTYSLRENAKKRGKKNERSKCYW